MPMPYMEVSGREVEIDEAVILRISMTGLMRSPVQ